MGDLILLDKKQPPAHLQKRKAQIALDEWVSGQTGGFPVISTKGKVFHIRRGDEVTLITKPDDDDEPASSLQVIVLKTHHGVAKTYYEGVYEEGSDDKPTCYSNDGIAPAEDAEERQAKKCALCPMNQWGSRITDSGKKAKLCSDVKRLAVAPGGQANDPMLLRVPPTSLKAWDQYVQMLAKRGYAPSEVITKISFDTSVSHQLLIFKAVDFVNEETSHEVAEILQDPIIGSILGSAIGHAPVEEEEEPAPPPPKPKAKQKAKAKPAPEPEEDEEEDDEPPPPPKPKAKRKAKPKPEPEPEPEDEEEDDEEESDSLDDLDFDDLDFGDDDEEDTDD